MQSGDDFGRYKIEQPLGRGGMGVVHLALDTQLQRRVALKVISHQLAEDPEGLARFHREAETLARLDSPHIVTIFDHGEVDGTSYLAMQYVTGGDLHSQLKKRGPVPVHLAASIAAQVAGALADAHNAGIVHRDIKPANVLVHDPDAAEPFVYLGDFGIAQDDANEGFTRAGSVAGSWAYLAPERASGAPATPASDIYALGCLFYACVTGRAPYPGSDAQMAVAHVNEPVPQLPGSDPAAVEVNRILRSTMAKDPANRYPSASDARHDLLALARGGQGAGSRAAAPRRRRGLLVGLGAAAAALVVLGGGTLAAITLTDNDKQDSDTPTGGGAPTNVIDDSIAGDLNADGLGDIRVIRPNSPTSSPALLLLSDGTAFGEAIEDGGLLTNAAMGDVDGDGRPDLVDFLPSEDGASVEVTRLRSNGDGVHEMSRQTFPWRTGSSDFGAGDFNGDGLDDLLMTRNLGKGRMSVAVAHSNGEGFDEPVEYSASERRPLDYDLFLIGDYDGDGDDDLATSKPNQSRTAGGLQLNVLLTDGERFHKSPTTVIEDSSYGYGEVTAADVDGDGADELVYLISVLRDSGGAGTMLAVQRLVNGSFGTPEELVQTVTPGENYSSNVDIAGSDVNGDGLEDIVQLLEYTEGDSAGVEVFLSDAGTLQEPTAWGEVPCADQDECDWESRNLLSTSEANGAWEM